MTIYVLIYKGPINYIFIDQALRKITMSWHNYWKIYPDIKKVSNCKGAKKKRPKSAN